MLPVHGKLRAEIVTQSLSVLELKKLEVDLGVHLDRLKEFPDLIHLWVLVKHREDSFEGALVKSQIVSRKLGGITADVRVICTRSHHWLQIKAYLVLLQVGSHSMLSCLIGSSLSVEGNELIFSDMEPISLVVELVHALLELLFAQASCCCGVLHEPSETCESDDPALTFNILRVDIEPVLEDGLCIRHQLSLAVYQWCGLDGLRYLASIELIKAENAYLTYRAGVLHIGDNLSALSLPG